MKKNLLSMFLVVCVIMFTLIGCGKEEANNVTNSNEENNKASKLENDENESKERTKMVIALDSFMDDYPGIPKALEEVMMMDKYSNIDWEIIERDAEYVTKMPITVAGGEQRDILCFPNPIFQQQCADAGTIIPLDEYAETAGIDFDEEFGPYAPHAIKNGKLYIIPNKANQWLLFYNKKIFDDAGIDYPDPKVPMTWEEYREIAKKLTSGSGNDKIYGTLHVNWPIYWYGEAIMRLGGGEKFYTEDGLSNIEDPAFAEAMKHSYQMMHEDKSMLTYSEVSISKVPVNAFLGGGYGMTVQGPWMINWIMDEETYPRDFKVGIAPMPVDEGTDLKTWGSVNGFAIGATSANPQLAFEIAIDLSRLSTKYSQVSLSANQTEEQPMLFKNVDEELANDGIAQEQILYLMNNPNLEYLTEKIMGPNNVEYEQVVKEETELYFCNEQDLETTIANIKERSDMVIKGE